MLEPDFEIDDEFDHYMPRTSELCDKALDVLIKDAGGAQEPLVVWDEANLLIDGHRRLRACLRLGLPFEVRRISCRDRDDAKQQMEMIQFSRRNMSDHDQAIWAKKNHDTLIAAGMTKTEAISAIAEQNKESERNVYRKVKYGLAFERLSDEWKREVVRQNLPKKYVSAIADVSGKQSEVLLSQVRKHGVDYLHQRAKRLAGELASKRRAARVLHNTPDEKEAIAPVRDLGVPDEIATKEKKADRVIALVIEAEKAVGASTRAVYKLCGQHGVDRPDGYWKRRMDKAHRELSEVLAEIRKKYE